MDKAKSMKFKSLIFTVSLFIAVGCGHTPNTKDNNIVLRAPDSAATGDAVPLSIASSNYILSGSEINVSVDNEPAVSVRLLDGFKTKKFSTRVRMKQSGEIAVTLKRSTGDTFTAKKRVSVNKAADIPDTGVSGDKYQYRHKDGDIKMMFANEMAKTGYITNIVVTTNLGKFEIDSTLQLAKNPYFALSHETPIDDIQVDVTTN